MEKLPCTGGLILWNSHGRFANAVDKHSFHLRTGKMVISVECSEGRYLGWGCQQRSRVSEKRKETWGSWSECEWLCVYFFSDCESIHCRGCLLLPPFIFRFGVVVFCFVCEHVLYYLKYCINLFVYKLMWSALWSEMKLYCNSGRHFTVFLCTCVFMHL